MNLITRIWLKVMKEWWRISIPIRLRYLGVELGKDVCFLGMPIIKLTKGSRIRIADRVVICSDGRFTDLGVNHPVVLRTLQPGGEIIIGNDCGISGGTICAATRVELGAECLIGANVTIADTDFHAISPIGRRYNDGRQPIASAPVVIKDNVFIGTGVIILKNVCVGENSVIGAGSVVTKNVPPNSVAAGNPAKVVKTFDWRRSPGPVGDPGK